MTIVADLRDGASLAALLLSGGNIRDPPPSFRVEEFFDKYTCNDSRDRFDCE